MPAGNMTIKAKWTINQYTATFNANGGSTANPQTITKDYNVALGTLPTTSRTGYTFAGWYTAETGGTKILTTTKMGASNVTYYAQWTINTYTITWKNYDGTVLETDKNVAYGTTPTYDGATPTKTATSTERYTFKGWTPTIVSVTGDATYVATYSVEYKVSFAVNNNTYGSVSPTSIWVKENSTISVNSNKLTIDEQTVTATKKTDTTDTRYAFVNWTTGANEITNSTTVTGNVTIVANFKVEYKVVITTNQDTGKICTDKEGVNGESSREVWVAPDAEYHIDGGYVKVATNAWFARISNTAEHSYSLLGCDANGKKVTYLEKYYVTEPLTLIANYQATVNKYTITCNSWCPTTKRISVLSRCSFSWSCSCISWSCSICYTFSF